MQALSRIFELSYRPSWGVIVLLLAVGIVFVGFGNADRVFWRMTYQGALQPGIVVDVRSYRPPEASQTTYVPKVAFRDSAGKIRVMEASRGANRYAFEPDQQVLVKWREGSQTVTVDLPFRRTQATSMIMSLFTALGLAAWLSGIWLLMRRIRLTALRMRQIS